MTFGQLKSSYFEECDGVRNSKLWIVDVIEINERYGRQHFPSVYEALLKITPDELGAHFMVSNIKAPCKLQTELCIKVIEIQHCIQQISLCALPRLKKLLSENLKHFSIAVKHSTLTRFSPAVPYQMR